MRLGELKVEALKLMFANGTSDVAIEDLDRSIYDERYADYLYAMTGAINRCLSELEERRVLPVRSLVLGDGGRYALDRIVSDFFDLERISCVLNGEYFPICEYYREGDEIIVKDYDDRAEYRAIYNPAIKRVFSYSDNMLELDIPDRIACYIPYFIKGELFRVDEPDEAAEARNWFEAAIDGIKHREHGVQLRVANVYEV